MKTLKEKLSEQEKANKELMRVNKRLRSQVTELESKCKGYAALKSAIFKDIEIMEDAIKLGREYMFTAAKWALIPDDPMHEKNGFPFS